MGRTRIKICGIRELESALVAVEAGADALGFVFVPGTVRAITPDAALDIAIYLPPFITKVALMVDPTPEKAVALARGFPFDVLQLHGSETPESVARCKRACGAPIAKAIRYDEGTIDRELEKWGAVEEIDALLIDGGSGGEGKAFSWDELGPKIEGYPHPVILAGGLNPENVERAVLSVRPYAVDVSSGVERARGVKDDDLIWGFCRAVRGADVSLDGE